MRGKAQQLDEHLDADTDEDEVDLVRCERPRRKLLFNPVPSAPAGDYFTLRLICFIYQLSFSSSSSSSPASPCIPASSLVDSLSTTASSSRVVHTASPAGALPRPKPERPSRRRRQ